MGIFNLFSKKEQPQEDYTGRLEQRLASLAGNSTIDRELITRLLSGELGIREEALVRARRMADSGDASGQVALEEAIRIKSNRFDCRFYEPRAGLFSGDEIHAADKEIYRLAKENRLMEDPEKTQSYISKLFLLNEGVEVMNRVRKYGDNQLHDFQLLGTQLQCRSAQIVSSRK